LKSEKKLITLIIQQANIFLTIGLLKTNKMSQIPGYKPENKSFNNYIETTLKNT